MAIKDTLISNNIASADNKYLVRGSDGTLYTGYSKGSRICVAYSTNSGSTWTEVITTQATSTNCFVSLAIDSSDILHFSWVNLYGAGGGSICYANLSGLTTWSTTVVLYTNAGYEPRSANIAIDNLDNVHIVYDLNNSLSNQVNYVKRTSGVWSAPISFYNQGIDAPHATSSQIAINSVGNIFIITTLVDSSNYSSTTGIACVQYNGSWSALTYIDSSTTYLGTHRYFPPAILNIDKNDNVHVVYTKWTNSTATEELRYLKYNNSTQLWSLPEVLESSLTTITARIYDNPSISSDSSSNLNVFYSYSADAYHDIYLKQYTGSWGASTKILDASNPNSYVYPVASTSIFPILGGVNTNIPTAGYQFNYFNGAQFRFYSSTDINFPAPQTQNYSKQASATLPVTSVTFTTPFTSQEYGDVLAIDSSYASQTAVNQYALVGFKNKGASPSAEIHVVWTGKTDIAPTTSTVYLQIFNQVTLAWETLTSNSVASANAEFTLAASKTTGLTSYYDAGNWVTCRIYQLAQ